MGYKIKNLKKNEQLFLDYVLENLVFPKVKESNLSVSPLEGIHITKNLGFALGVNTGDTIYLNNDLFVSALKEQKRLGYTYQPSYYLSVLITVIIHELQHIDLKNRNTEFMAYYSGEEVNLLMFFTLKFYLEFYLTRNPIIPESIPRLKGSIKMTSKTAFWELNYNNDDFNYGVLISTLPYFLARLFILDVKCVVSKYGVYTKILIFLIYFGSA